MEMSLGSDVPFLRETSLTREILHLLSVKDNARLCLAARMLREIGDDCSSEILTRRGFPWSWSWHKAHLAESAVFFDAFNNLECWSPGPNKKSACNAVEVGRDSWLWLSGGTDWQLFQGTYRQISGDPGLRPLWVSFDVCVATPAFAGAFVAVAPGLHTWGLEAPSMVFSYFGDEKEKMRRCFTVGDGSNATLEVVSSDVVPHRPYSIAVRFDWSAAKMSIFVDGEERIHDKTFNAEEAICVVALYNWRRQARHAIANLCMGDVAPPLGPLADRSRPRAPAGLRFQFGNLSLWMLAVIVAIVAVMWPKLLRGL